MLRDLRKNRTGVGGYFEDLPKLLFILFAVGLFLISTVTVYGAYNRYNENTIMTDSLNSFADEIISWNYIAPDRTGVLLERRLESLAPKDWTAEFPTQEKNFEYQIQIFDQSMYERIYFNVTSTQERPMGIDIYSKTVPVVVLDTAGNYRASHLTVAIWRADK